MSPYLLLQLLPGVGRNTAWQLLEHFQTPEAILNADPQALTINDKAKQALGNYQAAGAASPLHRQAQAVMEKLERFGATLVAYGSEHYPPLLAQTVRPPLVLFVRGDVSPLTLPQLAIVGSRHPSAGGARNARYFAQSLALSGFVVTSGLAIGIDGAAHQAVVDQRKPTIAVMATGVDSVYPKRHERLAEEILEHGGALVSEFLPTTPPRAGHFPERNRIISGLSCATIVVEAAIKSGSLITARLANEQNRLVFALPGSIQNPQSKGPHELIRQGAILAESPEDIAEHLEDVLSPIKAFAHEARSSEGLAPNEQTIYDAMGFDTVSLELLTDMTCLDSSELASGLMMLELKGLIRYSRWGFERV